MIELLPWILFSVFILVMLALDLCVFHRKAHAVSIKEAALWSVVWVCLALLFNLYIYFSGGLENALNFFTGYLIEKSLSFDNLFVFLLIFKYFHTPKSSLHKVLFWGVLGAIVIRAIFITIGITLVTHFHWIIYLLGLLLIVSGVKLGFESDKKIDPERNPLLKLVRRFWPVTKQYESDQFIVRKRGRLYITPLLIVLVVIETTDIVFAVDSIPAILAITFDPFIVFTSNIFAILGLRSLYFVLSHLIDSFRYLHYGLAAILIFIGAKMVLSNIYPIPILAALAAVFLILAIAILASLLVRARPQS